MLVFFIAQNNRTRRSAVHLSRLSTPGRPSMDLWIHKRMWAAPPWTMVTTSWVQTALWVLKVADPDLSAIYSWSPLLFIYFLSPVQSAHNFAHVQWQSRALLFFCSILLSLFFCELILPPRSCHLLQASASSARMLATVWITPSGGSSTTNAASAPVSGTAAAEATKTALRRRQNVREFVCQSTDEAPGHRSALRADTAAERPQKSFVHSGFCSGQLKCKDLNTHNAFSSTHVMLV